ncbi:MAG TPA: hypothetical protein VMF61_03725, partial [Candidatus Acidoferrales bacterium]|nr:hypothetical protein [Candidatus Acidoferrales bacterium]
MNTVCDTCGRQPAPIFDGTRHTCAQCAQRQAVARALPFFGAALAAAGLIAGSALLADRLAQQQQGESGGPSPLDELTKRLRGGTPTLGSYS